MHGKVETPPPRDAEREETRRLRTFVESLDTGVVVESRDGRVVAFNAAARHMLGISARQFEGTEPTPPGWRAFREDGWPVTDDRRPSRITLATGKPCRDMVMGVRRPDGEAAWLTVSAQPLFEDGDDVPSAAVLSLVDITERHAAEHERRRSSARFRSLIEYSSNVISIFDERGQEVYVSPSVEAVLGYRPDDSEAIDRLALIHPDDRAGVVASMASLHGRQGASTAMEYRIRHKDGGWRMAESVATNRLHDPAVGGIVVNSRDVTERRAAEAALRTTSSRLVSLVQNLQGGVLVTDEQHRIVLVNEEFCSIFGIHQPAETLVGVDSTGTAAEVARLLADPETFQARLDERVERGVPVRGEEVEFADGRTFERDFIPVSVEGVRVGRLWLYKDVTERKRTERELAGARDEAIRTSRLKSEFLATMSHEIRTPMNAVIGTVELLLDTALDADQRDLAGVVRESAYSLMSVIDDVLDISKIEAEKLEPKHVEFDLAALTEAVADVLVADARRSGLELTVFVDPRIGEQVSGDSQWLRQVLINLGGNAVKFTEQGDVCLRADLECEDDGAARVRFSVSDTGPGIPEWARPRLFEPFSQVDGTSSRRHGGAGLGLAICQRLVGLMGGEIEVASDEGAGSTFSFALSFGRPGSAAEPRPAPPALEVLVVEPHEACAEVVCAYLDAWGMSAARVDDPAEAAGRRFDVGIVAGSERLSSSALARAVHAQPGCARLPLVLLSDVGRALSQTTGEGDAPFAAVVTKPVKRGRLLAALSSATGSSAAPDRTPARPAPLAARPRDGARASVLVAEDNQVNRELLLRQLEKLGLDAHAVAGGREAVDAVTLGDYDAVLMDCHMPEVDGLTAAHEIRAAEGGRRRTPIVGISASTMHLDRERCVAAGMDGYLVKPLTTSDLGAALAPWIAQPLIDRGALDRLADDLGGRDELRRIARIYVGELAPARENMSAALTAGDANRLGGAAHRLRSTSASFGATSLARLCGELESRARAGAAEATEPLLREIGAECESVRRALSSALSL